MKYEYDSSMIDKYSQTKSIILAKSKNNRLLAPQIFIIHIGFLLIFWETDLLEVHIQVRLI